MAQIHKWVNGHAVVWIPVREHYFCDVCLKSAKSWWVFQNVECRSIQPEDEEKHGLISTEGYEVYTYDPNSGILPNIMLSSEGIAVQVAEKIPDSRFITFFAKLDPL